MRKKAIVYIDGFNLYYGLLKGTPWRWLDVAAFADALAGKTMDVGAIRYFTARIKPIDAADRGPEAQSRYLAAIAARDRRVAVEEGFYIFSRKIARNANPPPPFVTVLHSEEKGTDVNIACAMLDDAFRARTEALILVSGDSDLATPVRMVRAMGLTVVVYNPQRRPCQALVDAAGGCLKIWRDLPRACQLPPSVACEGGSVRRPNHW